MLALTTFRCHLDDTVPHTTYKEREQLGVQAAAMEVFGSDLATAAAATAATRSVMQVLRRGPWFVFFASTLVMAASGGANIFAVYSKDMKATFGYDQKTLNTLSSFKNLGASLGILPGLIISYNLAPPWVLLLAGAAMNLGGYLMMYLALSGHTAQPPVWLVCVYIVLGACSQTFSCTAALVTAVNNFDPRGPRLRARPSHRLRWPQRRRHRAAFPRL